MAFQVNTSTRDSDFIYTTSARQTGRASNGSHAHSQQHQRRLPGGRPGEARTSSSEECSVSSEAGWRVRSPFRCTELVDKREVLLWMGIQAVRKLRVMW